MCRNIYGHAETFPTIFFLFSIYLSINALNALNKWLIYANQRRIPHAYSLVCYIITNAMMLKYKRINLYQRLSRALSLSLFFLSISISPSLCFVYQDKGDLSAFNIWLIHSSQRNFICVLPRILRNLNACTRMKV